MIVFDIIEIELQTLEAVVDSRPSLDAIARRNEVRQLWLRMHADPMFKLASLADDPTQVKRERRLLEQQKHNQASFREPLRRNAFGGVARDGIARTPGGFTGNRG